MRRSFDVGPLWTLSSGMLLTAVLIYHLGWSGFFLGLAIMMIVTDTQMVIYEAARRIIERDPNP